MTTDAPELYSKRWIAQVVEGFQLYDCEGLEGMKREIPYADIESLHWGPQFLYALCDAAWACREQMANAEELYEQGKY